MDVSPKKAEELARLFRMISKEPMSSHLSDDEFVGYVAGELSDAEMHQIDRHLEICEECGRKIEHLAIQDLAWRGSKGTHRLQTLRHQILNQLSSQPAPILSLLEELARQIQSLLSGTGLTSGMVHAATEEKPSFQQGEQWSCYLDTDKNGNYRLRISSHDLSLEGVHLRLFSKNWRREITLVRVDPDQVGAKVVLSPEDLEKIPQGHGFSVELVHQDAESE